MKYTTAIDGLTVTFSTSTPLEQDKLKKYVQNNFIGAISKFRNHKDISTLNSNFIDAMEETIHLLHSYDSSVRNNNSDMDDTPDCPNSELPYVFKIPKARETVFDRHWKEHYNEIMEFKNKFGHPNVSRTTPGYDQLGNWLSDQRKKLRRGKMTRQQYEMLNALGVEWNPANISS